MRNTPPSPLYIIAELHSFWSRTDHVFIPRAACAFPMAKAGLPHNRERFFALPLEWMDIYRLQKRALDRPAPLPTLLRASVPFICALSDLNFFSNLVTIAP